MIYGPLFRPLWWMRVNTSFKLRLSTVLTRASSTERRPRPLVVATQNRSHVFSISTVIGTCGAWKHKPIPPVRIPNIAYRSSTHRFMSVRQLPLFLNPKQLFTLVRRVLTGTVLSSQRPSPQ